MKPCPFLIGIILTCCVHLTSAQESKYEYSDRVYTDNIKTVRLFPMVQNPSQETFPAALPIRQDVPLILEFDDLYARSESYFAKIVHCNADWKPSRLFPLDYIDGYNEFRIEDYEFSFNTSIPYVHYNFTVPKVKIPGNYVLVIFKDTENNVAITRRFVVFDNRVQMVDQFGNQGMTNISRLNQQVQFNIDYRGIALDNPQRNVKAVIRQNQRWDNAIYELAPTSVDEGSRIIRFQHFGGENHIRGGNQMRYFDLRSIEYFGRNVETVFRQDGVYFAKLQPDKPRKGLAYAHTNDQNGKFTVTHPFEVDYAYVEFFLHTHPIDNCDLYVVGAFNLWERHVSNKMEYVEELGSYYAQYPFKQGLYDYQYISEGPACELNEIEGDYFQTENEYDIMIYYRSFKLNADLLIGYINFNSELSFR